MKIDLFLKIGISALIVGCTPRESGCIHSHTVEEIISLNYRDANVKLDDNTIVTVNQATLKPGDKFCKKLDDNTIVTVNQVTLKPNDEFCADSHTVEEIMSLNYRDANVKLDDNTIVTVNQVTLKIGDKLCKKLKR